ncbi:cysteine hydrolase family protein [Pseudomonas sp. NPDC090755]|uniref:cysteine hydrolase family protein n=1 Tax=Pseudomonas sp. NPDC090755 TaxID=3364481 RepID=UPI00383AF0AB
MKALIVIDVQHGLFRSSPAPACAENVIGRINALSKRARLQGAPVIFVQHEATDGDYFRHGSQEWALDAGLITGDTDHLVRKTTPDSFLRTDLASVLKTCGVSHLVICGYASEFCIDTTVRRAAALGYEVTLVSDAHTTQDKAHADAAHIIAHHNATLPSIRSFGVPIRAQESEGVEFAQG